MDYTASPLQYVDITSGSTSTLTRINNNIVALQTYVSNEIISSTSYANSVITLME